MDRRIKIVFSIFCIWFIIVGFRLWDMQILHKTRYTEMSLRNRTRFVRLAGVRGRIYDRNGRCLVDNKAGIQLVVVDEIRDAERLAEEVSHLTTLSPGYILKKMKE